MEVKGFRPRISVDNAPVDSSSADQRSERGLMARILITGSAQGLGRIRSLADRVNQLGRMDAVIHNAGVYRDRNRDLGPEGHPRVLAVNTLASTS